jgi:hypothetical protein
MKDVVEAKLEKEEPPTVLNSPIDSNFLLAITSANIYFEGESCDCFAGNMFQGQILKGYF